jgi:hypothetical protein
MEMSFLSTALAALTFVQSVISLVRDFCFESARGREFG